MKKWLVSIVQTLTDWVVCTIGFALHVAFLTVGFAARFLWVLFFVVASVCKWKLEELKKSRREWIDLLTDDIANSGFDLSILAVILAFCVGCLMAVVWYWQSILLLCLGIAMVGSLLVAMFYVAVLVAQLQLLLPLFVGGIYGAMQLYSYLLIHDLPTVAAVIVTGACVGFALTIIIAVENITSDCYYNQRGIVAKILWPFPGLVAM